jgi:hypothetical protein
MKKDLIIGCFTNYNWDKIKFWTNSIAASGFTGDKAIIIYNSDYATVQNLINQKFTIYAYNKDDAKQQVWYPGQFVIVVQRFMDLYKFFSQLDLSKYRYVIHTDVKDVIFQSNPSDWLTANMGNSKIVASCESLLYKDEPWGNANLQSSFPLVYETLKTKPIWNCGVQAGDVTTMKDLWLSIYLMCQGNAILNPDQAAYNVLLNTSAYADITKYTMSEDGWAAQLGTSMDPAKIVAFKPNLLEPQPTIQNGIVCTSTGVPHVVVHQYDRIPELKLLIEQKYG